MTLPLIKSKENPRIKWAKRLQEKRVRQSEGLLLIEGVRLLGDAWAAGTRPLEVFYEPAALQPNATGEALLRTIQNVGIPCHPVTPLVFADVSDTVTPQGIAAVVPLPLPPLPEEPSLALILDGVRDPGNAGTLLRTAEAVGAGIVFFGPGSVDPFNGKVVRAGMGAHFRLPIAEFGDWNDLVNQLPGAQMYVATMEAETAYDRVNWLPPSALIVGNEAEGPSAAARSRALPISIPMRGRTESINAAMAGAVILFEAARQRRAATLQDVGIQ